MSATGPSLWHRCRQFLDRNLTCPYHPDAEKESSDSCWKKPWDDDCREDLVPVPSRVRSRTRFGPAMGEALAQVATDRGAYQRFWPDFEPQPFRPPWGAPRLPGFNGDGQQQPEPARVPVPAGQRPLFSQPDVGTPVPLGDPDFSPYAESIRLMQARMVRSLSSEWAKGMSKRAAGNARGVIGPWRTTPKWRPLGEPVSGLGIARRVENALASEVATRIDPNDVRYSQSAQLGPVRTAGRYRRNYRGYAAAIGGGALLAYMASRGLRGGGGGGFHFNVRQRFAYGYGK